VTGKDRETKREKKKKRKRKREKSRMKTNTVGGKKARKEELEKMMRH